MLNLKEATRKPFPVKFEQVTLENIEELAAWCHGEIVQRNTRMLGTTTKLPAIKLAGKERARSDEATLGCYIVEFRGSYRVYKPAVFEATFDVMGSPTDAELLKLAQEAVAATTESRNDDFMLSVDGIDSECEV